MLYKDGYPGYRITFDGQDTFEVVYEATREPMSQHRTVLEARTAAKQYHDACVTSKGTLDAIRLCAKQTPQRNPRLGHG